MTITPNELFRILSVPDDTFLAVRDANPAFAIHGTSPGEVAEKASRALDFYETVMDIPADVSGRLALFEKACIDLLNDVRSRHPGEDLHCPHMIRLDDLVSGASQ